GKSPTKRKSRPRRSNQPPGAANVSPTSPRVLARPAVGRGRLPALRPVALPDRGLRPGPLPCTGRTGATADREGGRAGQVGHDPGSRRVRRRPDPAPEVDSKGWRGEDRRLGRQSGQPGRSKRDRVAGPGTDSRADGSAQVQKTQSVPVVQSR